MELQIISNQSYPATWHPSPVTRGTWDLLWSCIVTLSLCAWTAVHLNVPEHLKQSQRVMYKTLWLLVALLVPELVAYTAFWQWKAAHDISTEMSEFFIIKHDFWARWLPLWNKKIESGDLESTPGFIEEKTNKSKSKGKLHKWTMRHSHYLLMGGFCFDTEDHDANFLPDKVLQPTWPAALLFRHFRQKRNGVLPYTTSQWDQSQKKRTRVTVTPKGFLWLAKFHCDLIPPITEQEIKDKSKADSLAKLLLCIQATWFMAQFLSRLAQGVPVSQLEINTFAHACCAVVVFILWWHKPKDIFEPTLIQGPSMEGVCALMSSASLAYYQSSNNFEPELAFFTYQDRDPETTESQEQYRNETDETLPIPDGQRFYNLQYRGRSSRLWERLDPVRARTKERVGTEVNIQVNAEVLEKYVARHQDGQKPLTSAASEAWEKNHPRKLNASDRRRLHLIATYVQNHILHRVPGYPSPEYLINEFLKTAPFRLKHSVVDSIPNHPLYLGRHVDFTFQKSWPIELKSMLDLPDGLYPPQRSKPRVLTYLALVWASFTIGAFFYGGMHLLAWNAAFPTRDQQTLWRASAIIASAFSVSLIIPIFAYGSGGKKLRSWSRDLRSPASNKFKNMAGYVLRKIYELLKTASRYGSVVVIPIYLAARAYLIIESVIDVAFLPPGSFEKPNWSIYFPHLSG